MQEERPLTSFLFVTAGNAARIYPVLFSRRPFCRRKNTVYKSEQCKKGKLHHREITTEGGERTRTFSSPCFL